jgi:hypothetical protein
MSHHVISGQDTTTGRAEAISAELNALKIYQDFPSTNIQHIVDNVVIGAGSTHTTTEFKFLKRTKILIFGTSNFTNIQIGFEISPESTSPFSFYETFENVGNINGAIYSLVNLYTDYFRLKITNNEASAATINLYATSKN